MNKFPKLGTDGSAKHTLSAFLSQVFLE